MHFHHYDFFYASLNTFFCYIHIFISEKMIRSEGLEPNSEKFHEITYNVEPYINRIKRSCKKGKIIGL